MIVAHHLRYLPVMIAAVIALFFAPTPARSADGDEKPVRLVWFPRYSPDSKWLITAHGGWDKNEAGEARVWDVETGDMKFLIPNERGVRTVVWSPKGTFLAAGNYGGVVRFYDPQTAKPIGEMKLAANVEVLQVSPDEKRLMTALGNGSVRVWEWPSKKEVYTWKQVHKGGIWGMRLSPDGKTLATAGQDHFVRVFDVETFKMLHELKHPGETNGLAFTNDGAMLLTGCSDATIRVFDVASGEEVRTLTGHEQGSVTDMQFSPDGKLLASAGIDRTVRLWDMAQSDEPTMQATFDAHTSLVFGVAISPNGKWLASAGWDDQVKLWDIAKREERWSWSRD